MIISQQFTTQIYGVTFNVTPIMGKVSSMILELWIFIAVFLKFLARVHWSSRTLLTLPRQSFGSKEKTNLYIL